jgi:hypothetical protein
MSHFWTPPSEETSANPLQKLTKEEVSLLLVLIKNSNFKGENVEQIYNLVLKLQEMYIESSK